MGEAPSVDRLKSIVDLLNKELVGAPSQKSEPVAETVWMGIGAFAKAHRYAPRTISRWVRLNMPHFGKGRNCRINVHAALAWIDGGGPALAARRLGFESHARSIQ
jgi:hypothetical protein